MDAATRVLIVEDLPSDAGLAEREIKKAVKPSAFLCVETREDFLKALSEFKPDIIVTDYRMPQFDGMTALRLSLERTPLTPVIILTSAINEDTAVECMKLGAADYVIKEHIKRLGRSVSHALEQKEARKEKLQTEQTLREREQLYRTLVDASPDAITQVDEQGVITFVSPRALELYGEVSSDDVIGQPMLKWVAPEDHPKATANIRHILARGYPKDKEYVLLRKDGSRFNGEVSVAAIRAVDGRPTGMMVISRDISERKAAADALQRSETRYRSLFETASDAIFIMRKDLFIDCNSMTLKMFGCTREQIIGQPPYRFSPGKQPDGRDSKDKALEMIGGALAGQPQFFQWVHLRYDGTPFDAEVSLNCLRIGSEVFIQAIVRDITDRKKTEEILKRYQLLSENARDIVFILEATDGQILEANEAAVRAYGYERQELLGMRIHDLRLPESLQLLQQQIEQAYATGALFETVHRRKNGGTFPVEVSVRGMAIGNERILLSVIRDITERRRVEEALRESESQFRELWEATVEGIVIHDQGIVVEVNQAMCRMFGYTREQVNGKSLFGFAPPEVLGRLRERMASGPREPFEIPALRADGRRIIIEVFSKEIAYRGRSLRMAAVRDITERKQVEEALRESEEKYRSIVETTMEWIWEMDLNGKHTFSSQGITAILGYRHDEFVGQAAPFLLHEEDRLEVDKTLQRLIAEKHGWRDWVLRWRHKDGSYRFLESNAEPILDSNGKLLGYRGSDRDVTKRKQAEEALRESEERLSSFMNSASDTFYVLDAGLNFVEINKKGLELIGKRREEVVGKHITEIVPDVETSGRYERHLEVLKTGVPFVVEDFVPHPVFGNLHFILKSFRAGDGLGVIASDITERKRAEEALRESAERYRLIVENAANLVAEVDINGNYIYVNPAHKVWLGYDTSDLVGKMLLDFVHPDDVPFLLERFSSPSSAGMLRFRHKDGPWRWLDASAQRVATSHEEQRTILVGRDITEQIASDQKRRSLESQLQQAQKLEAIGTLAGGIAHDFNNIIGVTLGNAELARMKLGPGHPVLKYIDRVFEASERARDLVQQILTFSRKQESQRKPLQIRLVVKEALKLLRSSLPTTIEMQSSLRNEETMVLSDPTQIHQVVVNLCTNAAHAMSEKGGTLEVNLGNVSVDQSMLSLSPDLRVGPYVALTVSDTGMGMDAATLERIFEPFFTTKGPGEGTGLGLAIVHGIVKSNEGAITVSSTVGKGTTFCIYLPAYGGEARQEEKKREEGAAGNGERILLVDDEPQIVELGSEILLALGYNVTGFTRPEEALRVFTEHPDFFDLVITDLTMPRMTGTELAKQVLHVRPGLPVVLTTGNPHVSERSDLQSLGISEVILKPFKQQTLTSVLCKIFSSGSGTA